MSGNPLPHVIESPPFCSMPAPRRGPFDYRPRAPQRRRGSDGRPIRVVFIGDYGWRHYKTPFENRSSRMLKGRHAQIRYGFCCFFTAVWVDKARMKLIFAICRFGAIAREPCCGFFNNRDMALEAGKHAGNFLTGAKNFGDRGKPGHGRHPVADGLRIPRSSHSHGGLQGPIVGRSGWI